jgi:hypothetical protein
MIITNGTIAPKLKYMDFNDNLISELSQIQNLKKISALKEIIF